MPPNLQLQNKRPNDSAVWAVLEPVESLAIVAVSAQALLAIHQWQRPRR